MCHHHDVPSFSSDPCCDVLAVTEYEKEINAQMILSRWSRGGKIETCFASKTKKTWSQNQR